MKFIHKTLITLLSAFYFVSIIAQQPKTIEIKEVNVKPKEKKEETIKPKATPKPTVKPKPTPTPTKKIETPVAPTPIIETPVEIATPLEIAIPPKDTIVKMGGKKVPIEKVIKVGSATVIFIHIDGKQDEWRKKDIEKILYKDKRVAVFSKPVFQEVSTTSWENVYVTENPDEVAGFFELGKVRSSSSTSSKTIKDAKKNAINKLQKRAAAMGAVMVLVTSGEAKGGYGEPPMYDIEGMAYASEKPAPKK